MERTLVIIGPSGSGKSTLATELAHHGLVTITPTWTTRPRRPDERAGSVNHRFVDNATFDAVERAGGFLGTAALFGHRYGLPPVATPMCCGAMPAVVARAGVLGLLVRHLPDVLVVQVEAAPARLRQALADRRTSPGEVAQRARDTDDELLAGRFFAGHVVVNDGTVDDLVIQVTSLVTREREAA